MTVNSDPEQDIEELFEQAIAEWIAQGRSEEQIHGVKNFNTGRAIQLRSDILAWHQHQASKAIEEAKDHAAKIYERELQYLRAFQESVIKRDQLQVPKPLYIRNDSEENTNAPR